jgi:hypothetical protein
VWSSLGSANIFSRCASRTCPLQVEDGSKVCELDCGDDLNWFEWHPVAQFILAGTGSGSMYVTHPPTHHCHPPLPHHHHHDPAHTYTPPTQTPKDGSGWVGGWGHVNNSHVWCLGQQVHVGCPWCKSVVFFRTDDECVMRGLGPRRTQLRVGVRGRVAGAVVTEIW